jgi:hypothetical protein
MVNTPQKRISMWLNDLEESQIEMKFISFTFNHEDMMRIASLKELRNISKGVKFRRKVELNDA